MISNKMKTMVSNSSVIRAMFEEGKRLSEIYGEENVFDYSIGNPNIEAPSEIKDIIIKILNEENPNKLHGYINNSGYEDVREGIAENINVKYNTKLNYENIVMTCGAAGGLNIILKSILNPGDEVIIFAPFFGEYINYVNNFDGKIKIISADTKSFQPNLKELEKEILTLKENSFKEEFESLKLEHESLVKNYEDIKSKNDKLTIENKDLSKKIKDNEANSQIAVTQMSFDTIGDNNLKDEILNLDLLNMTPLDAINALYSLQKKAKNN